MILTFRYIILLLVFFVSCQSGKVDEYSFVQLCDPQLGMGGYSHDSINLIQALVQINEMDPDFVVVCGDLVHHASDSSFSDFLEIMANSRIPFYLVPGNHDVGNIPNDTSLNYYREKLGDDYYSFTHNGYAFIVSNSQLWKNHIGEESNDHQNWFQKELELMSQKKMPIFIIGHHPMFVKDPEEEEAYFNLPLSIRLVLLDNFSQHGVVAYLSGHKHETLLNEYRGIQLVTGESTSRNFDNRPLGFRWWNVTEDTVCHMFVPLGNTYHP